jgi:hypothetical protein
VYSWNWNKSSKIMSIQTKDIGDYIVYSDGRVWSKFLNRFMKLTIDGNGYFRVIIDGNPKKIHRIVAQSFIPNPDNLPFIDHINNIKADNRVENLRWCTPKENTNWALEDGLQPIFNGENNGMCKLKESDVIEIYTNPNRLSGKDLAKQFGVSQNNISMIKNNKIWTHITKNLK